MHEERRERLHAFVQWVREHVTGDEKGQAQIFLDRLFQAFAQKGVLEVGGAPEFRIRKSKEDGGGTSFADLVWKPWVLVEMKRRGEDLSQHYRQAFDYWTRLVPGRPRYVVLCNFDEFWVFDFETQMDVPVDKVPLDELPDRWGPLAFLFPTREQPTFGNDLEAVTREAAFRLANCFSKLVSRGVPRESARRFVLQLLVALFAEDIDLLPKYLVAQLASECRRPSDAYDLFGGLFAAMNTPGGVSGGRFKGVDYFNGGLYSEPARIELHPDELALIREAAKSNWSQVRPEIFGTIFEGTLSVGERHAFGAHYTSPIDIMKIVGPTIVEPWRDLVENATTQKQLKVLLSRMHHYTVLDPACGSGNFLYVAYRELKRLEVLIHRQFRELSKKKGRSQEAHFGFVTARQFYGIDVNPFAVEMAKVTMMIARKLAIDELHANESALPLDNLDANFSACDALLDERGLPQDWSRLFAQDGRPLRHDVVIGNPPILGTKKLRPERGDDYVRSLRNAYPDVPGMADYCVYWIRKSHDHLPQCTVEDPVRGRAGLVGTQNIRSNRSRVGGLDHVVRDGTIVEAVDNQPWSGEANLHVSIVDWVKSQDPAVVPADKRLWFKVPSATAGQKPRRRGTVASKEYELDVRTVDTINASLTDGKDLSTAHRISGSTSQAVVCQGITPGDKGFVLDAPTRDRILKADPKSADVVFPYLVGRELLVGDGRPTRWIVDFGTMSVLEAMRHRGAFRHVEAEVLPRVRRKAESGGPEAKDRHDHLQRWWMHWRPRRELIDAIGRIPRYVVCSRVTKRPVFVFVHPSIRPGDAIQAFAFADDYSYGILQSAAHWQWFVAKCSKLKSDFRYTPESVFDTFPWPQSPLVKEVDAVAAAARALRRVRDSTLPHIQGGLRALYRTLELPGRNPLKDAHAELDSAVLAAYGFSRRKDLLGQLLALNHTVAARIESGEPITPPGIPTGYRRQERLVTTDSIAPD